MLAVAQSAATFTVAAMQLLHEADCCGSCIVYASCGRQGAVRGMQGDRGEGKHCHGLVGVKGHTSLRLCKSSLHTHPPGVGGGGLLLQWGLGNMSLPSHCYLPVWAT